ncbi:MAG TPA: type II toxin-antitoxin system RelE/ParE family toxin [Caulobacteraceae bacterium]|nr:type II toxin-antitoxin system RelE/ParE family toxin [Caulobacteraceae bacterium]
MIDRTKRLSAHFYQSAGGSEPVRSWLRDLDAGDRRTLGVAIAKVEFGWPIGLPSCRPMGAGLFEVRADISDGRIARVLFGIGNGRMVLLHAFIKKSRATPSEYLDLARRRLKEVM